MIFIVSSYFIEVLGNEDVDKTKQKKQKKIGKVWKKWVKPFSRA
jgi:hypothetical protein